MDENFWTDFRILLCGFKQALRVLFILVTVLLVLTVMALFGVERGSNSFGIVLLDFTLLVPLWVIVGGLLWKC